MALMGRKVAPASLVMAEDRIRAMDEQGIDMEASSPASRCSIRTSRSSSSTTR
jgi:hypothetical protein